MFESAELGHKSVQRRVRAPRPRACARRCSTPSTSLLKAARFPVIILVSGRRRRRQGRDRQPAQRAGWTRATSRPTPSASPPTRSASARRCGASGGRCRRKGRIGIFSRLLVHASRSCQRVMGAIGDAELDASLDEIVRFEQMLARRGRAGPQVLVPPVQGGSRRSGFKALEKDPPDALAGDRDATGSTSSAVRPASSRSAERVLRHTSTRRGALDRGRGPPTTRYRSITVGQHAARRARATRLDAEAGRAAPGERRRRRRADRRASTCCTRSTWTRSLDQGRLREAAREAGRAGSTGSRAASRVRAALGGGGVRGHGRRRQGRQHPARHRRAGRAPVPASSRSPRPPRRSGPSPTFGASGATCRRTAGIVLFDRSWYGRVLVERVEGFCAEADWMRAYREINDFEEQLVRHGRGARQVLAGRSRNEEQLRRFKEREKIALQALQDHRRGLAQPREVGRRTSRRCATWSTAPRTDIAPWTLVAAEDKRHARIAVLEALCGRIEQAL
ncbi:MAG: hypothetical protein MZV65_33710 [Chromatiales bacterium]|nr:hypothetical protein [Chromatiales bacterium]